MVPPSHDEQDGAARRQPLHQPGSGLAGAGGRATLAALVVAECQDAVAAVERQRVSSACRDLEDAPPCQRSHLQAQAGARVAAGQPGVGGMSASSGGAPPRGVKRRIQRIWRARLQAGGAPHPTHFLPPARAPPPLPAWGSACSLCGRGPSGPTSLCMCSGQHRSLKAQPAPRPHDWPPVSLQQRRALHTARPTHRTPHPPATALTHVLVCPPAKCPDAAICRQQHGVVVAAAELAPGHAPQRAHHLRRAAVLHVALSQRAVPPPPPGEHPAVGQQRRRVRVAAGHLHHAQRPEPADGARHVGACAARRGTGLWRPRVQVPRAGCLQQVLVPRPAACSRQPKGARERVPAAS